MSPRPAPTDTSSARYRELIAAEARHWGQSESDPRNPQLWDDPGLYESVLAPVYRHLVDRAARHARVLELGCGDGELTLDIAGRGAVVTGVDLSPERVARAEREAAARGLTSRASFRVADLNQIELTAGAYDCVVAHDALHHVLDLDHVLDQVRGALVPGGALVVSDFVGAGRWEKLAWAVGYAALPTTMPFSAKWDLRHRLRPFLASEREKRKSVAHAGLDLHDASPFEGISQRSISGAISKRFEIVEEFTYCPLWYHLVPKLRMPRAARRTLLGIWGPIDRTLHRVGLTRGSYVFVEGLRL